MGAKLLYRDSRGQDGVVELSPDKPCYVGRALDCAIRTDDAMVSRKHSMIRMENGGFYIEDLGSSNGTLVNHQRVSKQKLNHNDVVRCGSLWLRYVEEAPLATSLSNPGASPGGSPPVTQSPQVPGYPNPAGLHTGTAAGAGGFRGYAGPAPGSVPGQQPVPVPVQAPGAAAVPSLTNPGAVPRKRGTQRLDMADAGPGFHEEPFPPMNQPAVASPYGGAPMPVPGMPYGGPPAMPTDYVPYGGPPPMPGGFGSPPPMPGELPGMNDPLAPILADGHGDTEDSLTDDFYGSGGDKLVKELSALRAQLDELQANYDREAADGKRLRAEAATLRDRIEELRETIKGRDDQIKGHEHVAEELRDELQQSRAALTGARHQLGQMADELQTKERQLGRSQEDISKLKEELEDKNRQLADIARTKEEGWKKLNEHLGEIDQLREVINEQERMLEERRIGLISQEEVIKELRDDKERRIKEYAQLKAERDELIANSGRTTAQLQTVEEENKRLSRLLVEMQKGGGVKNDQTAALAEELKQARVELKKLESDRDRYQEMYGRADAELERLGSRVAQLEVELREAIDQRKTATSSQVVIEDALAKAEVARAKAAEEAMEAARSRDEAVTEADRARREIERMKRRIESLESMAGRAPEAAPSELKAENDNLKIKLQVAADQARELERTVSALKGELDAVKAELAAAQAGTTNPAVTPAPVSAAADSHLNDEIRAKAVEVYENINDVLSDIRNNIRLIQNDFAQLTRERSDDATRIISDTIQTIIDSAEDAKGVVRGLRELAEFH